MLTGTLLIDNATTTNVSSDLEESNVYFRRFLWLKHIHSTFTHFHENILVNFAKIFQNEITISFDDHWIDHELKWDEG